MLYLIRHIHITYHFCILFCKIFKRKGGGDVSLELFESYRQGTEDNIFMLIIMPIMSIIKNV